MDPEFAEVYAKQQSLTNAAPSASVSGQSPLEIARTVARTAAQDSIHYHAQTLPPSTYLSYLMGYHRPESTCSLDIYR